LFCNGGLFLTFPCQNLISPVWMLITAPPRPLTVALFDG
jgi:hypothetical protein